MNFEGFFFHILEVKLKVKNRFTYRWENLADIRGEIGNCLYNAPTAPHNPQLDSCSCNYCLWFHPKKMNYTTRDGRQAKFDPPAQIILDIEYSPNTVFVPNDYFHFRLNCFMMSYVEIRSLVLALENGHLLQKQLSTETTTYSFLNHFCEYTLYITNGKEHLNNLPIYLNEQVVQNYKLDSQWVKLQVMKLSILPYLQIIFKTPTHIRLSNHICRANEYEHSLLLYRVKQRLYTMWYFYATDKTQCYNPPNDKKKITSIKTTLNFYHFKNYKNKQYELSGLYGTTLIPNTNAEELEALYWGQYFHIGQYNAFGLGMYRIVPASFQYQT